MGLCHFFNEELSIICWTWCRSFHAFLYLALKVTTRIQWDWHYCPQRRELRLEDSRRHPQELSGDMKVTEDSRIVQESRKKRKDSWRVEAGKMGHFQKEGGRIWSYEGREGRGRDSPWNTDQWAYIDPQQYTRTNHYGLICELGDQNAVTAKRLWALSRSPQSNLVSHSDRVIRLGDQQIWISARHRTELLRIFLWIRCRNGGGMRAQLSELVTGWTSISKVLISRVMSP